MTEIILVEGVSDVQLISYFLQNVYGWKHENDNKLGVTSIDDHEHIESLSKGENQLILCGVGGNGKFAGFVKEHRINDMIILQDIDSLMVVTDRDEDSDARIGRAINHSFKNLSMKAGQWVNNKISDSFGQPKSVHTYLLIIPVNEKGALERVIINALKDIPEEAALIWSVIPFIDSLKDRIAPELNKINKANKATVGTFFSIRNPQKCHEILWGFYLKN